MNDFLKWLGRTSLIAVFWVFVLSININDRPIFNYANDVLVQNSFVRMLDEELSSLWVKVVDTARITFKNLSAGDEKA